jgi:hypothetical protein
MIYHEISFLLRHIPINVVENNFYQPDPKKLVNFDVWNFDDFSDFFKKFLRFQWKCRHLQSSADNLLEKTFLLLYIEVIKSEAKLLSENIPRACRLFNRSLTIFKHTFNIIFLFQSSIAVKEVGFFVRVQAVHKPFFGIAGFHFFKIMREQFSVKVFCDSSNNLNKIYKFFFVGSKKINN